MLNKFLKATALSFILLISFSVSAQPECSNYQERKQEYLDAIFETATGENLLTLQAYLGIPLDQEALDNILVNITTTETADFRISGTIMRILYFTDGEYDDQILPVLNSIPFWLPDPTGPDRQYWSENHMVMWMSSASKGL